MACLFIIAAAGFSFPQIDAYRRNITYNRELRERVGRARR